MVTARCLQINDSSYPCRFPVKVSSHMTGTIVNDEDITTVATAPTTRSKGYKNPQSNNASEQFYPGLPSFHAGSCNIEASKYQLIPLVFSEQQAREFFGFITQLDRKLSYSDVATYLELAEITKSNILLTPPWRTLILEAVRSGDADVLNSIILSSIDFLSSDPRADIFIKEAYSNSNSTDVLIRIHISKAIDAIPDVRLRRNILNQNLTSILEQPGIHIDWIAGYNQSQKGIDPNDKNLRSKIIKEIRTIRKQMLPSNDDYADLLFLEAYFSPKNLSVINELLTIMENDWDASWDFLRVFSENLSVKKALTRKLLSTNEYAAERALSALADSTYLTKPDVLKLLNHPNDDIGTVSAKALKILARRWGHQADVQQAIARGLFSAKHYTSPSAVKALGELKSSSISVGIHLQKEIIKYFKQLSFDSVEDMLCKRNIIQSSPRNVFAESTGHDELISQLQSILWKGTKIYPFELDIFTAGVEKLCELRDPWLLQETMVRKVISRFGVQPVSIALLSLYLESTREPPQEIVAKWLTSENEEDQLLGALATNMAGKISERILNIVSNWSNNTNKAVFLSTLLRFADKRNLQEFIRHYNYKQTTINDNVKLLLASSLILAGDKTKIDLLDLSNAGANANCEIAERAAMLFATMNDYQAKDVLLRIGKRCNMGLVKFLLQHQKVIDHTD